MGISIPQLIVVVIVLVLLFGTGRLRTLGEDLGAALKGFRKALGGQDDSAPPRLPEDGVTQRPAPAAARKAHQDSAGSDDASGKH